MDIQYHNVKQMPVVIIDNFYEHDAVDKMLQEMFFLNNDSRKLVEDPELTGSAYKKDDNNNTVYLKQLKALFLDQVYRGNRSVSNILLENRKLFSPEIKDLLQDLHIFFKYISFSNYDSTILNYYENSDHYLAHEDLSIITAISWIHKVPKMFSGGELCIEDELTIECKSNRIAIFSSMLRHEVYPVKLDNELIGQNLGRFSITQLLTIREP